MGGGVFIVSCYPRSILRCQHIKINGTQCGSPALRGRRLCYFHNRWRQTRIDFNKAGSLHFDDSFELPTLEDADSIQVAIMQVLRLIIARHIDAKTAGLLLYGLQTASINLKQTRLEPDDKRAIVIAPRTIAQNALGDCAWYADEFPEKECEPHLPPDSGAGSEPALVAQPPAQSDPAPAPRPVAKPLPRERFRPATGPGSEPGDSLTGLLYAYLNPEQPQPSP